MQASIGFPLFSPKRTCLLTALGSIAAYGAGTFLYGTPAGPDEALGGLAYLGTALLFLSFLLSQLSWGRVMQLALERAGRCWEAFFFGSLFFSFALSVAGFFPLIGASAAPGWRILLLSGPGILLLSLSKISPEEKDFHYGFSWPLALALLAFALVALSALIPQPFWDSLWYHLTGSRLWFEHSKIYLPEFFPAAFLSGLWDTHFLFAQILLGGPGGGGLVAAHLFAQWCSVAAAVSCFVTLASLPLFRSSPIALALAGTAGVELVAVAPFAKNDWGASFWGLAFLSFLLKRESAWLLGLAAGASFSAKFTAIFFLAPYLAFWLWKNRQAPRQVASLAFFFFLAATPILARNQFFTGNAFFPAWQSFFPLLGPSWSKLSDYSGLLPLHAALPKLTELFLGSPATIGILALPFAWKKLSREQRLVAAATLCSTLAFFFLTGAKGEWRLEGSALLLVGAIGWLSFRQLVQLASSSFLPWAEAAFLAILVAVSPLEWRAPFGAFPWKDPSLRIREYTSGSSLAWIRLNAPENTFAATLNEQRIYYLFPHQPIRAFDWPALDQELSLASSPAEALEVFRSKNIRFLVLSAEFLDRYFNRRICDWMFELSESHPEAVVFRANLSRVLDLNLL